MTQHLASCQACARRADEAARLDRLWDATAPAVPGPAAWDRVWSAIDSQLDALEPARLEQPHRPHLRVFGEPASAVGIEAPARGGYLRRARFAGSILAAAVAAAMLLVAMPAWLTPRPPSATDSPLMTAANDSGQVTSPITRPEQPIELEEGQVPLIRDEGGKLTMIDLMAADQPYGDDPWFPFLGRMEAADVLFAMSR